MKPFAALLLALSLSSCAKHPAAGQRPSPPGVDGQRFREAVQTVFDDAPEGLSSVQTGPPVEDRLGTTWKSAVVPPPFAECHVYRSIFDLLEDDPLFSCQMEVDRDTGRALYRALGDELHAMIPLAWWTEEGPSTKPDSLRMRAGIEGRTDDAISLVLEPIAGRSGYYLYLGISPNLSEEDLW